MLACLNCAHTAYAVERLDQFNPQEKKELESITKNVVRDTREKGLTPKEVEKVKHALDQFNKPNLSLDDVQNALMDFPVQAYPLLLKHTRYSELNIIKTIAAVAALGNVYLKIEELGRYHAFMSKAIAETNDMLDTIRNDDTIAFDPDLVKTMQKNMKLLESDLQAFNLADLDNIYNVLQENNEEFLQLGQAEGSDRLDAEIMKLGLGAMHKQLKTLYDNLAFVQRGGNLIPEKARKRWQNQVDAVKAMHLMREHQKGRGMATIQIPQAGYIAEKYL